MVDINKSFSGVKVLKDVSFEVARGEVHSLLGHNGAGKSVLMKTLMGVHQPDSGKYLVNGREVRFANPADAQRNGVSMVYQEFGLVKTLTVAENIFMGRWPRSRGVIDWNATRTSCEEVLARIGSRIPPRTVVGTLKVAQQQEVEIARALSYDPSVFVMDEPTAALSYDEVSHLYDLIAILRRRGVAIVYITHKLDEVFHIADRVTVIRDGSVVSTCAVAGLEASSLVEKITGRKVSTALHSEKTYQKAVSNVLEIRDLGADGLFSHVSLTVGRGEIVGIAGLIGAGKTELAKAIYGALPKTHRVTGTIVLNGRELELESNSPSNAAGRNIGFVTEDRQLEGIVAEQSVLFNVILPAFSRVAKAKVIIDRLAQDLVRRIIGDVNLRPPDPRRPVKFLSGGNQQKVVIGKWLAAQSELLLLDEPTRGVDVGAREEIYSVIRQQARKGLGVLLLSSDLREIMLACDRILVMRLGRIVAEVLPRETSDTQLLHLVMGQEAGPADEKGTLDDG
jgi:ABC-type sugar transport system ATPase subunit